MTITSNTTNRNLNACNQRLLSRKQATTPIEQAKQKQQRTFKN